METLRPSFLFLLLLSNLLLTQAQAEPTDPDLGWKNESELGYVMSQGNSVSESTNLKQGTSYKWSRNTIKGQYHFFRSESSYIESARRWDALARFDRDLTERFGYFLAQGYESDPYAGFNSRANSEVGVRQTVVRSERWHWLAEAGYRYSSERRIDAPDNFSHLGRVYTELNTKWSETVSSQIWVEYLPNFSRHDEYRANTEASLSAMLTQIFSLKSAYSIRYNNSPPPTATQLSDRLLTTSLVAKF